MVATLPQYICIEVILWEEGGGTCGHKTADSATGDTIGIVTTGSPLDASVIDARVQTLQGMGFQVVLGEHVYAQNGFLAGTDQERASDLMNMFRNEQVKMILPSRRCGVAGVFPYLISIRSGAIPRLSPVTAISRDC